MKRLVCPYCGGKFRLEEATTEALYYELGTLDGRFGRHWAAVDEYIDCFAQRAQGTVPIKRRIRIANEIYKLFETCEFEFQGKRYRTDHKAIIEAMLEICNLAKWGFRNHNYLKIMLKKTAERVSAEGLTAKEETAKEEERKVGSKHHAADGDEVRLDEALERHPELKNALNRFGREP